MRRVEPGEAQGLVDRGEVDAAFLLPAGLSASFQQGGPATVTVVASGESPIAGQVARSLAEAYAAELAATRLAVATALDAGDRAPTATQARRRGACGRRIQPVQLAEGRVGERTIEAANYFGPSMAIFFLFFTVSLGARSVLAERRQGILRRLLPPPPRPAGSWPARPWPRSSSAPPACSSCGWRPRWCSGPTGASRDRGRSAR